MITIAPQSRLASFEPAEELDAYELPLFPLYYNDVFDVPLPPNHRFPMSKYGKVRRLVQQWIRSLPEQDRNIPQVGFYVSPLATVEQLTTTHCPEYVERYISGKTTEQEQRNVGFPWSAQGVKRSISSVGGTVAAAIDVCRALQSNQNAVVAPWGAHIAGGTHHAFYDYGEGFCVFSDIAVAANVVLQNYPDMVRRILILDLDVHQGNGNAVLFQNRPEVFTFSLHCEANYFSAKQQSDLDIELPAGVTDATYLATLSHWLKQLRYYHTSMEPFDLIFFQAGVDILEQDRLGRMDISSKGVQRRNQLVYEFATQLNVPMVISMGGGYPKTNDWTPILESHAGVYFQAYQFLTKQYQNALKDATMQH